ncbi:short chain dehydrogenase [Rhodoferax lacus]|uniref:Short chain dehydrogenase n=1 Tax=Rhodoferax lacus TaxID=2184758 RepID=A0A3E1RAS7_9BURK|nr:SDR family oxidoreductase [Rhodoferax lacus]RFO96142.1 short chain dehydrogenase [Rhodoferax lacus]
MNVLLIGASRGIGLEFARQYIDAGDRVIATARDAEGLQRLQDLGAQTMKLDVSDPASISSLSWKLDGEKLDLAIYIAGVFSTEGALSPPTQQSFDRLLHTNVLGAMQAIPQVAPWVEEAGGQFAFITSDMGRIGGVSGSRGWLYQVSKAALNMAVVAAQPDYPRAGFVLFHPGWVQTDMGTAAAPLHVEDSVSGMRRTLLGLKGAPKPPQVPFLNWDGAAFTTW